MKKKIILIGVIILLGIICFKVIVVNYYSFKELDKYAQNYLVDQTITIKKSTDIKDYIKYQNIMIPNLFKDYNQQITSNSLILVKDNNQVKITISTSPFQELTSNKNIDYYLKQNKINNELEIFAYIASQKYQKDANILTSIKYLKGRHALLKYVYDKMSLKDTSNLVIINGSYNGYINKDNYEKIINIIQDDKLYEFTLEAKDKDIFSDELIITLLNNLVIK